MALFSINNIKISGVSACVPIHEETNWDFDLLNENEKKLLIKTTGIEKRRVAEKGTTTADLCFTSAKTLLKKLNFKANEIELIIFVSQSPDYFLPSTSTILQDRLELPTTAMAFDINLGCSGYVYGLSVISSLMTTTKIKKSVVISWRCFFVFN